MVCRTGLACALVAAWGCGRAGFDALRGRGDGGQGDARGAGAHGDAAGAADALPPMLDVVASSDAFICDGDELDANYGSDAYSHRAVGQQNSVTGNQIGRQLYQFALPPALGPEPVQSATLELQLFDNFAGFPYATVLYGSADDWTEASVTFATQPALDSGVLGTVTATCCGGAYTYDVTAYVDAQLAAGDHTISFSQRGADEATVGGLRWWMREGDGATQNGLTGRAPHLVVIR